MSKIKNKVIYSDDQDYLKFLAEELDFIGRQFLLELKKGKITQFALPPQKPKPKKETSERDKRKEKFERRDK